MDKTLGTLRLAEVINHTNGRFLDIHIYNPSLLEGKELILALHNLLYDIPTFLDFGFTKIVIATAFNNTNEFNLHPNILIDNKTSRSEYFELVKEHINVENYSYEDTSISTISVKVWNVDDLRNRQIKITKQGNSIIPNPSPPPNLLGGRGGGRRLFSTIRSIPILKDKKVFSPRGVDPVIEPLQIDPLLISKLNDFFTLDIETMEHGGIQIPILIGFYYNSKFEYFLINKELLDINVDLALKDLYTRLFDFINKVSNYNKPTSIFVHNLGGFDGYFLYKGLTIYNQGSNNTMLGTLDTIIDNHNKFILINYTIKSNRNDKDKIILIFKDSLRIFPMSLNDLCKVFGISGKLSEYNPLFNSIDVLDNKDLLKQLIEYNEQDCVSLYNSLWKAHLLGGEEYAIKYFVDITTIVSTSSLALKIFRTNFQKEDITILSKNIDSFVRQGYYGGATDFYLAKIDNLKYYDVNSLYPFAMTKSIPVNGTIVNSIDNLDNFFGFCKVEVTLPYTVERPLLPVKHGGKTIFPTGKWVGVYFSEELKAVKKYIPFPPGGMNLNC